MNSPAPPPAQPWKKWLAGNTLLVDPPSWGPAVVRHCCGVQHVTLLAALDPSNLAPANNHGPPPWKVKEPRRDQATAGGRGTPFTPVSCSEASSLMPMPLRMTRRLPSLNAPLQVTTCPCRA